MENVIHELRPVESLYILNHAGKERWTEENSLATVLVFLSNQNYIVPKDDRFCLTEKGIMFTDELRDYELDCLEAIAKRNCLGLLEAVENFDFQEFLTEKGFFKKEYGTKGLWIFKWDSTDYLPTEKYKQAQKELKGVKEKILSVSHEEKIGEAMGNYLMAMSYVFPSEELNDRFLENEEEVIDTVHMQHLATHATINAEVVEVINNIFQII